MQPPVKAQRVTRPALRGAAPVGVGKAVPARIVRNTEIAARLGVTEQWLARRTGTDVRHVSGPGERLDQLAAAAARAALRDAGLDPAAVDAVLVATTSAEEMSPHAAPLVADALGIRAAAIDVSNACVGFVAGLTMGAALIEASRATTVVVVGADCLYRYLDPDDPRSAMLFGDGAGAVVLTAVDRPSQVGPTVHHSDGAEQALIRLDREEHRIRMDGPAVFRHAVRMMTEVTDEILAAAGLDSDDVDLYVYHQANGRILDAVGHQLGLDPKKVVDVIARYANTSAASLPIALADAADDGRLRPGDTVLLAAFGAGLVWGGTLLVWGRPPAASATSPSGHIDPSGHIA